MDTAAACCCIERSSEEDTRAADDAGGMEVPWEIEGGLTLLLSRLGLLRGLRLSSLLFPPPGIEDNVDALP